MTRFAGRYQLHDVVGTGGFATVYRATDPSLQAVVAVKVLADNWSRDPEVRRRFRAEAVLLRRARSAGGAQGLVEVYDIDEDDAGQPYYVMGYADRGTLAERARCGPWSAADVVPVIHALADTVGALHDDDIVHRDLKPSNVLILSDGRAGIAGHGGLVGSDERLLVADLGLARDLRRETSHLSFAGGSRPYLAPEQLTGGPIDRRADVHAATAIVAELLGPGDGGGTTLGDKAVVGDPAGQASTAPVIGPALQRVLDRGLAADPAARPPSMAAWRQELLEAVEADSAVAVPTNDATPRAHDRPDGAASRSGPDAGELHSPGRPPVRRCAPTVRAISAVSAGVVGVLAVVAIAWVVARSPGGGGIAGPGEIVVGEAVRYRAPDGHEPVSWTGPGGERVVDADLEVRAVVPGRLRIELRTGDRRVVRTVTAVPSPAGPEVRGPERARVGQPIELRPSSPDDGTAYYWLDPDGARVDGEVLRILPARAGTTSVVLVARGDDGVERGARHVVDVVP